MVTKDLIFPTSHQIVLVSLCAQHCTGWMKGHKDLQTKHNQCLQRAYDVKEIGETLKQPQCWPRNAESGGTGMRGGGSGVGPGWGHPHSVLLRPLCSLPWASPAPSPSSLAPWTPPRVLRVSREVPAALSLLPVRTPAPAPSLCRNTRYCYSRCATATAGVHTGDGPGLSSLPSAPRAFEHGPDAEGDTSSRHDQRGAPGKGWAQVAGELPGLPSLGLHSRPLCLRRATEVACGPHLTLLLARVCPP